MLNLSVRNNQKTKHLAHLLDGDVFDRKSKAAGFNRYFLNQHSMNETSANNSTSGSPTHKKPSATAYSGGERVLSQLGKPLAANKNSYTYTNENGTSNMPIIINQDIVTRDIYSISDSYQDPTVATPAATTSADAQLSDDTGGLNYAKINSAFDNRAVETVLSEEMIAASGASVGDNNNFEVLYSQVTKKPSSTRNSSLRNDQALYMNTFYSS